MLSLRFRWALIHLLACVLIAGASTSLVLLLWYPSSVAPILGVGKIVGVLVAVDVICGPLLTALLSNAAKPRRELMIDLTFIAVIQLGALSYGLYSLYAARPVAIAFEVDRLIIVTANQVQKEPVDAAAALENDLDFAGLKLVAVRKPKSSIEYLESLDYSIQGVTPAMRPNWWRPIVEARSEIAERAKPLTHLIVKKPDQADELRAHAAKAATPIESLRYLPFVSSRNLEWIALLDPADKIVGTANIDGFE
jgi:hypothetical protein